MSEHASQGKTKVVVASKAVTALFVFALLCFAMTVSQTGKLKPGDYAYPTWTSWKVQNYLNLPERAQLVFLGSSLMHTPMGDADANFTNRNLDATKHHKSLVFENKFRQLTGNSLRTFSFALPGEMPSDAYLITNFMLRGEKRPDVIVYGVGPRDFLEYTLVNPSTTDPFKYLSRFGDYSKHINLIKPDWLARFDYELGNIFYPYGKKEDIQTNGIRWVQNLIAKVVPEDVGFLNIHQRKQILPGYHPYEVWEKEAFYRPTNNGEIEFKNNLAEYRYRYKKLKWDTVNSQLQFFTDLLKTAKARNIHVVVVAMPITKMNKELLNEESWSAYHDNLVAISNKQGATFIDLDQNGGFILNDFADTVHLRASGGKKLFDILAHKLALNKTVIAALSKDEPEHTRAIADREDSRL